MLVTCDRTQVSHFMSFSYSRFAKTTGYIVKKDGH